jgi:hypothetical protein
MILTLMPTLNEYQKQTGMDVRDFIPWFAKKVKKHPESIRRWLNGVRTPRDPKTLGQISKASDGVVTANDIMEGAAKKRRRP